MSVVDKILYPFRHLKRYIFTVILSAIVFLAMLFPLTDLGDLITTTVSEQTNGAIFLQPNRLEIGLYPSIGVKAIDVVASVPVLNKIEADTITVAPNIPALLQFKPGASVYVEGLYEGDAKVSAYQKKATEQGGILMQTDVSLDGNKLDTLLSSLPVEMPPLKGTIESLEFSGLIDPTMREQPDAELEFQIAPLNLSAGNVQTPFGPFPLPAIKIGFVNFEGKISDKNLRITSMKIGKPGDDINGTIAGNLGLSFGRMGAMPGAFDFSLDLNVSQTFENKMGILFAAMGMDKCRKPGRGGGAYRAKLSGAQFGRSQPQAMCE